MFCKTTYLLIRLLLRVNHKHAQISDLMKNQTLIGNFATATYHRKSNMSLLTGSLCSRALIPLIDTCSGYLYKIIYLMEKSSTLIKYIITNQILKSSVQIKYYNPVSKSNLIIKPIIRNLIC